MEANSFANVRKEGKEVFNVQSISNDVRQPPFRAIPDIVYKGYPSSALSMIPPKNLMIQDVRCCYTGKIREVGDMEIRDAYKKLCDNRVLREEYKIIEHKGLNRAPDFPQVFKIEWIGIILSCILLEDWGDCWKIGWKHEC